MIDQEKAVKSLKKKEVYLLCLAFKLYLVIMYTVVLGRLLADGMGSVTVPGFRTGRRSVAADVSGRILAGNSCCSRERLPASFVPLTEIRAASHDRFRSAPVEGDGPLRLENKGCAAARNQSHTTRRAGRRSRRALDTAPWQRGVTSLSR